MTAQISDEGGGFTPFSPSPVGVHHLVQFYETDAFLAEVVADFLAIPLRGSEHAVLVATAEHTALIVQALVERGIDTERAQRDGALILRDAHELLEGLLVDGLPDTARFDERILPLLDRPAPVRVFGEMVDILWRQGALDAANRLEDLWNEAQRSRAFYLLCAYAMDGFKSHGDKLSSVCSGHTHVLPPESDSARGLSPQVSLTRLRAPQAAGVARQAAIEHALRDSLHELYDRQQRLETITDALPVLVSYVGADLRYRFANEAYERWFGRAREEIVGKHLREILGEEAFERLRVYFDAALTGETVRYEARAPYRHGGERYIEASYIPHRVDGRVAGFVAFVSDVSERRQFELARDALSQRTERLLRVATAIANAITIEEVFSAVVDQVALALDASTAGLWLLDEEGHTLRLARSFGYSGATQARFVTLAIDASAPNPTVECVRERAPVWIDSKESLVEDYPSVADAVVKTGQYRIACLPLMRRDEPIGAMSFTFDGAPSDDRDEQHFLMLIARYSSQALERLRLLAAESRSRRTAEQTAARMALLSRASRAFAEAHADLPRLLQTVVRQVTDGYADGCSMLMSGRSGRPEVVASHHIDGVDMARPPSIAVSETVATTGTPLLIPYVDETSLDALPEMSRHWLEPHVPCSVVIAPLNVGGRTLGALCAVRGANWPPFDDEDLAVLEELAERAAMAIEGNRLQEDNRVARKRAELLYGLAAAVMGATEVEHIFDAALDAIEQALGTKRSAVLSFDGDGVMRFRAWRGLSPAYRAAVEGHSPWSADTARADPIVVTDARTDDSLAPYRDVFELEQIGALAFIPLFASGRLLGKLMVYYDEPRQLEAHELDMAGAIANHIAGAIGRFSALAKLQESVRFNEMFTGILGHDLRNPLGAIMTAAHLAMRRGDNERLIKPLARILTSGERMARMIDQMLDFTRVRVGTGLPTVPRSIDLVALVKQVIDELDDAHPDCRIALEHRGWTEGSWDDDRLAQVFSNLVGNAVEHGVRERGVRVVIDGLDPEMVVVEIRNMGTISEDAMIRLFEPLSGGARRRHKTRGLGLGLFISREIVKAHGGQIEVRSSEAAGTIFRVALPRSSAPQL